MTPLHHDTISLCPARIVVDIDDTLCHRLPRWARLWGLFWVCWPMEGAAEALRELHRRYGIVYVTARNRLRAGETRRWLRRHGFPVDDAGIYFRWPPGRGYAGYKEAVIARLKADGLPLAVGLGDHRSDAQAYHAAGLHTLLLTDEDVGDLPVRRASTWAAVPALVEEILVEDR
jgi:hypothetical protein